MATGKKITRGFDWILIGVYLCLVLVGLTMVYSTTYHDYLNESIWGLNTPFGRQLVWSGISIASLLLISLIDWQVWNTFSLPLYVFAVIVLIALLAFGTEIKGARSWLRIASFSIQPSEFAKIATLIFYANLLSSVQIRLKETKSLLVLLGVISLPALLIILQPDPGSALTFGSLLIVTYRKGLSPIYFIALIAIFLTLVTSLIYGFYLVSSIVFLIGLIAVLNFKRTKYRAFLLVLTLGLFNILTYRYDVVHYSIIVNALFFMFHLWYFNKRKSIYSKVSVMATLLFLSALSLGSSYAFHNILKPHQQDRINVWLQPEECDPQGSLYNLIQSKFAIGSGGLRGRGFLEGTLTKLNYVPEQTTDFIFSSIGEEQGFVGSALVVVLFLILIMRIVNIGEFSSHLYILYFSYGVAGFIFIHFFLNIGMTMGLSPVIGIPLPFISKGGSSLLAFSIMIGIVLSMSKDR